AVLTYCGKRLGGGDPLLVLPASLEAMAGSFESQKSAIQTFITDKSTDHITVANTAADNALLTAFQLPGLLTSEEQIESVSKIICQKLSQINRGNSPQHKRIGARNSVTSSLNIRSGSQIRTLRSRKNEMILFPLQRISSVVCTDVTNTKPTTFSKECRKTVR